MWRSRVAALTCLVVIVVAQACGGGGAQTATVTPGKTGSGGTRVWAFSDANIVQPASVYSARLAAQRSDLCQTAESGSKSMQLQQALASLEAALARAAGPAALAKLESTKVGKSPAQAETVAAAEIVKANPGGALAALLIAHKKDPKEARHLENAAVVAISLGYPQEALALLAAAKSLPEAGYSEMGMDRTARLLNNQAYALIRLGRWSDAIPLLNTAIGREPLLAEAQRNLAVALLCTGSIQAAGAAQRAGERRNHFNDIGDPTQAQRFDPAKAYDLSKGQRTALPQLSYPTTLDQAAGASPKFESDLKKRTEGNKALSSQMHSLISSMEGKSPLTIIRTIHTEDLSQNMQGTPELAQLFTKWRADLQSASDLAKKWNTDYGNATTDCENRFGHNSASLDCFKAWCAGAQPAAHDRWLPAIKATDKSLRSWADAYSVFASGLASNVKDPPAHQWILVDEQYWLMINYTLLLGSAQSWVYIMSLGKGLCFDQATDEPSETNEGDTASGPSCTDLIGGASFGINLEVVSINVSCEQVGIEADAPLAEGGFAEAGLFGSVSYGFKNGSTTLFAGTYAKTNEIGGLSAGAKAGLYMTVDQGGNMQDVGMRGESSIDQSHGPGSASVSGPEAHISFVGTAVEE
jgi:tetratricopeptide (TPR) repeat protein